MNRKLLGLLFLSSLTTQAANIYVTASGNTAFDASLQRSLQSFGHSVTIGVPYYSFDGTQVLAGFDAVYLQLSYNWDMGVMESAGQTALVNFVKAGGGLVTAEWLLWKIGDRAAFPILSPILPVDATASYSEGTAVTFTQDVPDPELNAGLASTFNLKLEYIDGGFTNVTSLRTGASSFYKMNGVVIALAGWNVGSGRVLSFATTNGQEQLNDANFQKLLSNAMDWVDQTQPVVGEGGAVNAASFTRGQPVAAGSLVAIFGSGLASSRIIADSIPLPSSLGGVSVTFNNIAAPLQFVSPQQINAQVPWAVLSQGATSGTASMVVRRGQVVSQTSTVQIVAAAPGIFSVDFGAGQAIATNDDGSLSAPVASIPGIRSEPARIGQTISVLCTGLGAVDPPGRDGQASLDLQRRTLATPAVLIDGVSALVQFSGLASELPGVYQLRVVVPQVPLGDRVPIQIRLGDITSSDRVTIAVRN